jgi:hypothetical protein
MIDYIDDVKPHQAVGCRIGMSGWKNAGLLVSVSLDGVVHRPPSFGGPESLFVKTFPRKLLSHSLDR